ncbi:MAG: DUF4239 domain-containing protein [Actinobacteria bacterium]|nr:DUF4239 domain-containing protein [Actinomycetota bacterium]MBV8396177.1 DUF4239 domain-containing protein [Actinomycetota bacterium]MBV8598341.1 DUF4239 domain-containing protein [Actinomycetota bacterium]
MGTFDRWLLNTFSTPVLVIFVTGAFVICAVVGLFVVQRLWPHLRKGENNDVAGFLLALVAVLYGIVLGFIVIALYERFNAAQDNVQAEATSLSQLYRDTLGFPAPVETKIKSLIEDYSYDVRTNEWNLMKHGKESELSSERVVELERTLEDFQPKTQSEIIYANQAANKVNDLVSDRRTRLSQSEDALPGVFQVLLIGGAIITVFFLYFFGMEDRRSQVALVAATAALIGFSLALALVLDYPFAGQVSVSNSAFHAGILRTLGP